MSYSSPGHFALELRSWEGSELIKALSSQPK